MSVQVTSNRAAPPSERQKAYKMEGMKQKYNGEGNQQNPTDVRTEPH